MARGVRCTCRTGVSGRHCALSLGV
jgi:hypothetical protein